MNNLLIGAILILSGICTVFLLYRLKKQPFVSVKPAMAGKLTLTGILSFIADSIGIGSFAVNVALSKLLNTFNDEELPAVNNGAQVIPGTLESLFFMQLIDVDWITLISLVIATCIGGLIGGTIVSRLNKKMISLIMMSCFGLVLLLLLLNQFHWLPLSGSEVSLRSWKLGLGVVAMIICGTLTSAGVGLFAMVQAVLFLLNVSPLVAFPIMTAAGALQQPLTTMVFLRYDRIPIKKTLILSLGGCIGVGVTIPLFNFLSVSWLHLLLMLILAYNIIAIGRGIFSRKESNLDTDNLEPSLS